MGRKQLVKAILFLFAFVPFLVTGQNYPRFELYQLKQGTDSGQFIVTGLDSNLAFNNILRFRSADTTFLIGTDTIITDQSIVPILLRTIDAGLGIDVNQVDNQIFIESLSIEDSIYNGTLSTITKGTPLYAVGVQGNYWSVAPADASVPSKMPVVVIAAEDIASGATGLGLIKGHIKQVSTVGLADGAEVYVASGGGYTSTKPTAEGVIIQRLGTVIKGNSANGSGIINLGDEAYWNDYLQSDLTNNYAWIGNASNEPAEVLATSSSTANTIIRRDANQRFASGFITMDEGVNNIGVGSDGFFQNLQTSSGINNIAIGSEAGKTLSTGDYNVFIGTYAGRDETGTGNTYIGNANSSNSSGVSYSTNIGAGGDGRYNYGVGVGASNTVSTNGVAVGYSTTARTDAVAIGYNAFANSDGIAIGSNVTALTDEIVIGNSNNISLKANNYKFNIDQPVLGKNGFVLTYNAITQEIELDSAGGGGGAVGGIDSVIADQVTILGNGVDQTLRVDTVNTIATKKFVLDNSGGSGTSPWTIDGANIYYNSGNVGIGNNSPSYKLHVTGTSFVDGSLLVDNTLYLGNGTGTQYPYISGLAGRVYFNSYDVLGNGVIYEFKDRYNNVNPLVLYGASATNQMVVQGNSNLNGALNVEGNFSQTGSFLHDGGSVNFNNTQANYDFGIFSDNCCTSTPFMWVDASTDRVQIGTGNPQYTLDVTGDINFTGDLYDDGVLFETGITINNNTNNYLLTASGTSNVVNGESSWQISGSNLNGSSASSSTSFSPGFGAIYDYNGTTGPEISFRNTSTTPYYAVIQLEGSDLRLSNAKASVDEIVLKSSGTVQFTAYGSGTLTTDASGNISASDGRFKTVTRTMESGLDKVMKLKPLYYRWNQDSGFNTEFEEAGFIAQDVKKVIPEAVPNDEEEGKKLNYSDRAIIATLTKAIQEQQEMIEELQKEIKRIKRKIK